MGKVNEEQMTAAINAYLTNNMSLDQCGFVELVCSIKYSALSEYFKF